MTGIIEDCDHIPDYRFELRDETVYIYPKDEFTGMYNKKEVPTAIDKIRLKPDTYTKAKKFAKGRDIYAIEEDWRIMLVEKGGEVPRSPDGSYINYVKWYSKMDNAPIEWLLKIFCHLVVTFEL